MSLTLSFVCHLGIIPCLRLAFTKCFIRSKALYYITPFYKLFSTSLVSEPIYIHKMIIGIVRCHVKRANSVRTSES